ncbi:MAG TPA: potassium channel family protein [Candidatus Nanopelagicales bacterium]|nr:potassium channel family protein [Candidatus Nanopelagicales bacterium]
MTDPASPRGLDARALLPLALGLYAAYQDELSYETYDKLKQRMRHAMVKDPIDSILATALLGSTLFLAAERGVNPRCQTFLDALVFVTTSMSVGYDNKFPQTEAGKAIMSFMQTFGPSMAASALNPPDAGDEGLALNRAMLDRLDKILDALSAQRAGAGPQVP